MQVAEYLVSKFQVNWRERSPSLKNSSRSSTSSRASAPSRARRNPILDSYGSLETSSVVKTFFISLLNRENRLMWVLRCSSETSVAPLIRSAVLWPYPTESCAVRYLASVAKRVAIEENTI